MRTLLFTAIVLAFATTISLASYLGTESVLEQLSQRDAERTRAWGALEDRVTGLEIRERALISEIERLRAELARVESPAPTERTLEPTSSPTVAAAPAPPPVRSVAFDPLDALPGSLIDDPSLLTAAEQRYLDAFPPDPNLHLIRGEGGQLGLLGVRAVCDGRPQFIHAVNGNPDAIEQLSIALLAHERAKAGATLRLASEGSGELFETMAAAVSAGRSKGGYRTLETEEGVRLFTEQDLLTDTDVQATLWTLEATKIDVGESPSTVLHWIDPRAIAATR